MSKIQSFGGGLDFLTAFQTEPTIEEKKVEIKPTIKEEITVMEKKGDPKAFRLYPSTLKKLKEIEKHLKKEHKAFVQSGLIKVNETTALEFAINHCYENLINKS